MYNSIRKIIFTSFFFAACFFTHAENVKVRIFSDQQINSFIFSLSAGGYELYADGKIIPTVEGPGIYQLDVIGDSISVKALENKVGVFSVVYFIGANVENTFKIKSLLSAKPAKTYDDNLIVSVVNKNFKLVNDVDIENYVAGVVESESGGYATAEYYKLQSILCRSYTLSSLRRHELEGFNLCDQVHCQAYNCKTVRSNIISAVSSAKGLVIVDSELELISAAYHSNCGGETVNSENVWLLPKPYLKSIKDTFCTKEPHATWQKKISTIEWTQYLASKYNYPVSDSFALNKVLTCSVQNQERCICFPDAGSPTILLRTIRDDWKLKSTFFTVTQKDGFTVFNGRGFGHGIGVCQEGAMQMSKKGYSYKDIIHYYYKDVHIVDLSVLDFFKQE